MSIPRAGLAMLDGFLRLIPLAKVGCLGIYFDTQTLRPVEHCCKVPESEGSQVFMLDPMLAKGGTAVAAAPALKAQGATTIRLLCLLAAPEGGQRPAGRPPGRGHIERQYRRGLNQQGYMLPGIGDWGDRLDRTK
ncbi:MAG: uracil phosphoribosyltransferase [Candidatus Oleimicrobiaceae bacterium]